MNKIQIFTIDKIGRLRCEVVERGEPHTKDYSEKYHGFSVVFDDVVQALLAFFEENTADDSYTNNPYLVASGFMAAISVLQKTPGLLDLYSSPELALGGLCYDLVSVFYTYQSDTVFEDLKGFFENCRLGHSPRLVLKTNFRGLPERTDYFMRYFPTNCGEYLNAIEDLAERGQFPPNTIGLENRFAIIGTVYLRRFLTNQVGLMI